MTNLLWVLKQVHEKHPEVTLCEIMDAVIERLNHAYDIIEDIPDTKVEEMLSQIYEVPTLISWCKQCAYLDCCGLCIKKSVSRCSNDNACSEGVHK